jgi:hypothetical protein
MKNVGGASGGEEGCCLLQAGWKRCEEKNTLAAELVEIYKGSLPLICTASAFSAFSSVAATSAFCAGSPVRAVSPFRNAAGVRKSAPVYARPPAAIVDKDSGRIAHVSLLRFHLVIEVCQKALSLRTLPCLR